MLWRSSDCKNRSFVSFLYSHFVLQFIDLMQYFPQMKLNNYSWLTVYVSLYSVAVYFIWYHFIYLAENLYVFFFLSSFAGASFKLSRIYSVFVFFFVQLTYFELFCVYSKKANLMQWCRRMFVRFDVCSDVNLFPFRVWSFLKKSKNKQRNILRDTQI